MAAGSGRRPGALHREPGGARARPIVMAVRISVAAVVVTVSLALSACAGGAGAPPSLPQPATRSASPTASPTAPPSPSLPPVDSGIAGTTVVDGGCPVQRVDQPCPDRPFQARIVVARDNASTVASVQTDADGRFRIPLPPGRYVVRPASPSNARLPRADPLPVVVEPGRYTTITVRFDSGIR
jgi:hypothetical protein